jgi:hypothetical protein
MKTAVEELIKTKTEEYRIKKNNIMTRAYLTTFTWNGIEYALIHMGGYGKIKKYLIQGEVSGERALTELFINAYIWGTSLWNDTYLMSDHNLKMTIIRHEKIAYITQD